MLKLWTVAIPIETMAQWLFIYFYGFRLRYLFSLNGYDLLTGYTCTRVPVHTPSEKTSKLWLQFVVTGWISDQSIKRFWLLQPILTLYSDAVSKVRRIFVASGPPLNNQTGAHWVWTTTAPTLSFKYRCRCPSTMCCSIFQKRFIHTYIRKRFFKNNKNILPSITRSNSAFILSRHAEDVSDRWQRGAKTSECQQSFFFPGLARNKTGLHPRACNFSSLKYTINNTYEKTIKC